LHSELSREREVKDTHPTPSAEKAKKNQNANVLASGALLPSEVTPERLATELRHWTLDRRFMSDSEYRERHNPFPGLDLNAGNTRERCEGLMHFAELPKWKGGSVLEGGPEERMRIEEGFGKFSLWRCVISLLPYYFGLSLL
jgi:hypothetical protein